MTINISNWQRIVSNPCGGFDYQEAKKNKGTGEVYFFGDGKPRWSFVYFMPTLEKMMKVLYEKGLHDGTVGISDINQIVEESRRVEINLIAAIRESKKAEDHYF